LVVVVAAGEFGAEVEEAPWAREIEIRDPDGSRFRVATPERTFQAAYAAPWCLLVTPK
jgi:hypothetical protein